jgi:hypothetical protein
MPRKPAPVAPLEDFDPEDPRIAGKDPTMVPGHPLCNYEKFLAAQPKVDVVMQPDWENRHLKTFHLGFNSYQSPEYPFNETVRLPRPLAVLALLTGRATTTDGELMRELAGQIGHPKEGPQPGPLSGAIADPRFEQF